MDNNKLDYESTSEDNTSIEENERIVKLTKRASSKYINPNPRKINQPITNQTTNISTDIRKMVKVSTSTLLLIKCRK